jgi:hypothetical protein
MFPSGWPWRSCIARRVSAGCSIGRGVLRPLITRMMRDLTTTREMEVFEGNASLQGDGSLQRKCKFCRDIQVRSGRCLWEDGTKEGGTKLRTVEHNRIRQGGISSALMDMLELGMRDQVKPAHRVLEDAHGVSGGTVHPSKSIGRRIRPDGYQAERDGTESLAELLEHGADRRGGVDGFGVVQ